MPNYTLYLDESGQVEYPKFDSRQPILGVGGVAIADSEVSNAERAICVLRSRQEWRWLEGSTLRYSDIVSGRGQYGPLKDGTLLRTFLSQLYVQTLTRINFESFVGCIDKPRYLREYGTRPIDRFLPQDPHLVAFSFVIERFVTFLEQNNTTGKVIYEHRDPWRNAYLQWEYVKMHVSGTQYLRSSQFNRVLPSWIEFVPKARKLVGLELADLIVGPTNRKVADPDAEMIEWEAVKTTMWRGSNPSAPGQMGLEVFPGNLGKELLAGFDE